MYVVMLALLQVEDRWFMQHPGVNPLAMARATGVDECCVAEMLPVIEAVMVNRMNEKAQD
jgi:hypothetical protein